MRYETIMSKIASGLTGEHEHDMQYLRAQSKKYSKHKMGTEILPPEAKEEFRKSMGHETLSLDTTFEEVEFLISKKEFEKAFGLIDPIVRDFLKAEPFKDDSVNEYHFFPISLNTFCTSLCSNRKKNSAKCRWIFYGCSSCMDFCSWNLDVTRKQGPR
jgi:hypothetical protein